jgi:hypothetical protein
LGLNLGYTPDEACHMGLVRLLARDFGIPVARASELANEALQHPPETRSLTLSTSQQGAVALIIDLARYYSAFVTALSAAITHGEGRRRGRPPTKRAKSRSALRVAESHGVDLSLLRETMGQSPAERLARLDANALFLNTLRRR